MASSEMTATIELLESQAEKVLAEARAKAAEILRQANDEANRILASDLALEGVKTECSAIVEKARREAAKAVDEARSEAERMKARAQGQDGKKTQEIARRIEAAVRGAS